jgi:hypothetical protein
MPISNLPDAWIALATNHHTVSTKSQAANHKQIPNTNVKSSKQTDVADGISKIRVVVPAIKKKKTATHTMLGRRNHAK